MIHVLLIDDHPSVVEGTRMMLEKGGEMQVTIGYSGYQALELIPENKFDVMMFDLNMPEMNGVELTKQVLSQQPDAIILIYTGMDISPQMNIISESGAVGFILKTATREQIIRAIQCATHKEAVVPIRILNDLIKGANSNNINDTDKTVSLKEIEILKEIAKGKSNKEIASKMAMSQRSLEYGLTQLFGKLHVHSRIEAVTKSKSMGILKVEDFI